MSDEPQRIEVRRVREGRAIRLVLNGGGGVQAKSKVTPAEAHRVADDLREAAEAAMDAGDDLWEEMTGERPARSADPDPDDREGLVEADQYVVCGMGGYWVADDYDEARRYAEEELKMLKRDPARDDPAVPIYRVSACEQVRALRGRLQAQEAGDGGE